MKELIKKYWWVILIIGWGITFLIYSQKIKNKTQDLQFANVELSSLRNTVDTFKTKNKELVSQINEIITIFILVIYFIVSFTTMAWHITWILFIINVLIEEIVKLIFSLKGGK